MTKKKILTALALVVCAVLLVVGSVAGTLAYLTSTAKVTNTFTVGNVSITMDELAVDVYGKADTTANPARRTNNTYKLIPGNTYIKDPTITVGAGSEACYLFVKVENNLGNIEIAADATKAETIVEQILANGWIALDGEDSVYYKDQTAVTTATPVPVFANFTVADNATLPTDAAAISALKVNVTAYAVQKDGLTVAQAWDAVDDIQVQ